MADVVDSGLTSTRRKKRVVVVRAPDAHDQVPQPRPRGLNSDSKADHGRRKREVTLARPVRPGEDVAQSDMVVRAGTMRRDPKGKLIERSMLGTVEDMDEAPSRPASQAYGLSLHSRSTTPVDRFPGPFGAPATRTRLTPTLDAPSESGHISVESKQAALGKARDAESRRKALDDTMTNAATAAQKERKEVESHRKNLLIHERSAAGREERARARWEQTQEQWGKFRKRMASKLKRSETDLVVAHADDYRERIEELELLERATPKDDKDGAEGWLTSLRGGGTRYIQIGSIFSGLYCPVSDEPKPLRDVIKRPRKQLTKEVPDIIAGDQPFVSTATAGLSGAASTTSKAGGKKSWKNTPSLRRKRWKLRKHIATLRPHEVSEDTVDGLEIRGAPLLRWAQRSQGLLEQIEARRAADSEAAHHVEEAAPEDATSDVECNEEGLRKGPWLSLQVVSDSITGSGDVGAAVGVGIDDTAPTPSGAAEAARGWPRIVMEGHVGTEMTSVLRFTNRGTTALYYSWRRINRDAPEVTGSEPRGVSRFNCPFIDGSVLPGKHVDVAFTFQSPNAGVFRETWQLTTTPPGNRGASLRIALRGIATDVDEEAPAREALETRIADSTVESAMREILYDVIADVRTPRGPPSPEEQRAMDKALFERQNPGLMYWPATFAEFADLHARVVDILEFPEGDRNWDGSAVTLGELIGAIEPKPETEEEKAARLAEAAAREEEEAKGGGKGKKKSPRPAKGAKGKGAKGGKGGKGAAEPEPFVPPPLTKGQKVELMREGLASELSNLVVRASRPQMEQSLVYPVARQIIDDLVTAIPIAAGAARAHAKLELRDGDVPAVEGADDDIIDIVTGKRKLKNYLRGEDSEDESEEEESEEEDDSDAEAKEPEDPQVVYDAAFRRGVRELVGMSSARFAAAAADAEVEAVANVAAATGMNLLSKADLTNANVAGQTVLLRSDLDVPLTYPVGEDGTEIEGAEPSIASDAKITAALPTIRALIRGGAAAILVTTSLGSVPAPYVKPRDAGAKPPQPPPSAQLLVGPLSSALGRDVAFVDAPVTDLEDIMKAAAEAAAKDGAAEDSKDSGEAGSPTRVLLWENVLTNSVELESVALYSRTGNKAHLGHGTGHPMLDRTPVAEWTPVHVSLWAGRQCPGIATQDLWRSYVGALARGAIDGKALLTSNVGTFTLKGLDKSSAAILAGAAEVLKARHRVEQYERARMGFLNPPPPAPKAAAVAEAKDSDDGETKDAHVDEGKDAHVDEGKGAEEDSTEEGKGAEDEAGIGPSASSKAAPGDRHVRVNKQIELELSQTRTSSALRVSAYHAALSRVGDVFVNDAFSASHIQAGSVSGVRPRHAVIKLQEDADGVGQSAFLRETCGGGGGGCGGGGGGGIGAGESKSSDTKDAVVPARGMRLAGLSMSSSLRTWGNLLTAGAPVKRPFVAVVGGAGDLYRKAAVASNLLNRVDVLALGGVLGAAWASVVNQYSVGATPLPGPVDGVVRRLAGQALRRGVKVLVPMDFATGSKPWTGPPPPEPDSDEEEDEESDEDSDDDDSDEEAVAQRKSQREAAKAEKAEAARRAAEAEEAARQAMAKAAEEAACEMESGWDGVSGPPGQPEPTPEYEFDGEVGEETVSTPAPPDPEAEGAPPANGIPSGHAVFDLGSESRDALGEVVAKAGTVLLYGPLGLVEVEDFQAGTRELAAAMAGAVKNGCENYVAGGATSAWITKWGFSESVKSTLPSGPAARKLLEGAALPGVVTLSNA